MIYLDHNATTPVLPEVFEAMRPYFCEEWGNPSSSYRFGSKLKAVIELARAQVAELIGANPREILFTSCATESNNAAIHAALKANPTKRHIVTSTVEHSSVLSLCKALERDGYLVTYLSVDRDGLLRLADLDNAIVKDTAIVSLMWANNETGVLFPVMEIAELCNRRGVLFHCDAVQAAGKVDIDVLRAQPDYLSLTGHKFNAPKGVGALYVRRKAPFLPLLHGGHQEGDFRGGTESVLIRCTFGLRVTCGNFQWECLFGEPLVLLAAKNAKNAKRGWVGENARARSLAAGPCRDWIIFEETIAAVEALRRGTLFRSGHSLEPRQRRF